MSITLNKVTTEVIPFEHSDIVRNFLEYLAERAESFGDGSTYSYYTKRELADKVDAFAKDCSDEERKDLINFVDALPYDHYYDEDNIVLNITW